MKTCIIFCAAEFDSLAAPIEKDDYILAADGGLRHLEKLGLKPNGIIGDFDSLGFVPEGAEVFPVEKDDTDAMLAARKGLELGFRNFLFYGSLDGPRLDHTVANFQTLQFLADRGAKYELEKGTLTAGFPLGVSNHFVGKEVTVAVERGSLLLLWDRAGMPRRATRDLGCWGIQR